MQLHANSALSLKGRRQLCRRVVDERWTLAKAAEAAEVSTRCARKWVRRYRSEGQLGLLDRSSAPSSIPHRTPEERVQAIAALRRLRFTAPELAELLGMPLSTVSGILTRIGMGKLGRLGLEPARRYERERPGELIHIDVKKLGRMTRPGWRAWGSQAARVHRRGYQREKGHGWEFVHVAIDDCTRLAYAEVLPTLSSRCAVQFLRRAVAWFAERGVRVRAVMSDNGSAFIAYAYRNALSELGLRHLRIRPYRPRTNGKAERFIQTLLGEWAYERIYGSSAERAAALPLFLERYNFRRPHGSLGHRPPASRLTNLVGNYT